VGQAGSPVARTYRWFEKPQVLTPEAIRDTGWDFVDFEAVLVRLEIRYCRRERRAACPMAPWR
jgi:hypothetical protein